MSQGATNTQTTAVLPTGSVQMYAGGVAPSGWLFCDGTSYSRSTYSALFGVVGTAFGSVDAATFNVPDLRGRVPVGAGTGAGEDHSSGGSGSSGTGRPTGTALTARALGAWGGQELHTLATGETPAHNHPDSGHVHGVGTYAVSAHAHPAPNGDYFGVYTTRGVGNAIFPSAGTNFYNTVNVTGSTTPTLSGSSQSGTATIGNTGGGGSHNVMQPYVALNYIIKY